jgi:hypothetical protein
MSDQVAQEGVRYLQSLCFPREVQLLRHAHAEARALQVHDRFIQVVHQAIKQMYWTYLSPAVKMIYQGNGGRRYRKMTDTPDRLRSHCH